MTTNVSGGKHGPGLYGRRMYVPPLTTLLSIHLPLLARVTYAYGRDGVFPLSWIPGTVNRHTQTPVNAVWMNTTIGILLLLIYGGSLAISAICAIGLRRIHFARCSSWVIGSAVECETVE